MPAQAVTSGFPALAGCSLYLLAQGVRSPWEVPNAAASGPWPRLGGAPLSLQVPSQVGTTQPQGQGVLLGCSPGSPRAVKPGDDARARM